MIKLIIPALLLITTPTALIAQGIQNPAAVVDGVGSNALIVAAVITIISLAPAIAIMVTAFPFIVTVFSILRLSMGLQQAPPNMLIISLSLFLTWFVMDPVLEDILYGLSSTQFNESNWLPEITTAVMGPLESFMNARIDPDIRARLISVTPARVSESDISTTVPAFMLSEIERAFQIGFLISLPFLIIDLAVAAVLMAMGMMMVPPAVVSLPFKISFFVVVDGWSLLSQALVSGYA